ncbi:MAG: sugar transferase [Anaerolineaceae bacterium]|nr:sugar transferase [Anaerolineaceae bacterium]
MGNFKSIQKKPFFWRINDAERRIILLVGDLFVSYLSIVIALFFWSKQDWLHFTLEFIQQRPEIWFYFLPILWIILLVELYDVRSAANRGKTIKSVTIAAVISLGLYLLVYFTSDPNSLPRRGVAAFIVSTFVLTILWRYLYIRIFTTPMFMRRVLIVGCGRSGLTLASVLHKIWPPPFFVVGYIDDDPEKLGKEFEGYPVLGANSDLKKIIEEEHVTDLVFAISGEMNSETFQELINAEESGVEITTMPVLYEELLGRVPILLLKSDWLLRSFLDQAHTGSFYNAAKRLMDIAGGLVGLGILAMIFPFVALTILIDSGWPIFYTQDRLGKRGKEFRIIKFRTMIQESEKDGVARMASQTDNRITRVGNFLRKSHLDEFPQFINIFRGDMSLVGPRAEQTTLVEKLQKDVPFYRARLLVKPGATGWAQVNFGYAATVEETRVKLEYDLYYIKHQNLIMDISIIIRTIGTVFGLRGQ